MVMNKKINRVPVMIHKEKSGFVVYIDGDRLDDYKTQKEAEKMAVQFVKQYKGK
jgi:predicted transcriptional regulator